MRFYRSTWAEINLSNLAYNFNQIKKRVAPTTKIMVTIKADAYGHGLIPVAKKLISCGADYLGVASIDEGMRLRENNVKLPVLILGAVLKQDIGPLFKFNLMPTVCTEGLALALNNKGSSLGKRINIHVKVDTGMGRLGVLHYDAFELIKRIHRLKFLRIEGVFTHFPFADTNRKFTAFQMNLLKHLAARLSRAGIVIPLLHAANSAGILNYKSNHLNMVRPGLVIYGLYPQKGMNVSLRPVLSLKTRIVFFKRLPKGHGVSYGHTYITDKETTIVTLPIGYGDGYPHNLSNKAPVLIGGRRFRIAGRICMDQIMVDVGSMNVRIGQEVVLIGSQGKNRITVEELAILSETIPYEIVCGLGSRIPRIYVS